MLTGVLWVDVLLIIAATITALSVIVRGVVGFKPGRWFFRRIVSQPVTGWARREIGGIVDTRMDPTIALVKAIDKELHPNNGATIRDAIDRNEVQIAETKAKVDELHSYTHTFRHEALAEFAGFRAADSAISVIVDKLGEVVTELQASRAATEDNTAAVKESAGGRRRSDPNRQEPEP